MELLFSQEHYPLLHALVILYIINKQSRADETTDTTLALTPDSEDFQEIKMFT